MTPLELRPYTAADEPFVRDLMLRTLEEELAAWAWPPSMRSQLLEVQYRGRVDSVRSTWPDAAEHILLVSGDPVGRIVTTQSPAEIRILDIALLPERRNAGIGAAAIGIFIEESNRSARPLRLSVNTSNRAQHLYHRLGFTKAGASEVQYHLEWTPAITAQPSFLPLDTPTTS